MMVSEGFSVENIAFGMGGALLQKVDRDTQKFAFKCSSIVINDEEVDVRKNPIEINENGERVTSFKKSKSGRMKLMKRLVEMSKEEQLQYFEELYTQENSHDEDNDILVAVFENGEMLKEWSFESIRDRAQVEF